MNPTINKQELIDWLNDLEDQAILETIQSIKNSQTKGDWWDDLSEAAKEEIKRGEADVQARKIHSSEDFWKEINRRRKNRA